MISLSDANKLISAILAERARMKLKPLSVVVTDPGGHVVAFQREDGASHGRFALALGKASGALFLGVSSRAVGEMAADRPSFIGSLASIVPGGIIPAAGGVVINGDDGRPVGAVAVTGDTSDNDERAALAGLRSLGLHPLS
ncbi:heme-binding protein [Sphingopyxis sp. YF1]|uniref:GlcG/HbpS family heme-binding protein n=1 Tax=Sphingopyxis sp. YF1 TaxID=2482763 RepID=UPI001F61E2AF|nr:heme-binding protein [Sphingopyxis sp. YF1]UNU43724.1 heme-binding protein [Sphingopyxis sp. YF1]